jgi:hypothetical protein
MKKLLFLIPVLLLAFKVEFTKIYKQYVIPNKPAILIETHDNTLTFPFHYIKIPNGYILYGDINQINMWLNNDFYAPNDAKFKNIKIAIINPDKIQYKIINKIQNQYKKCKINSIIFLSPDEKRIILQPQYITLKYKIILNCK